MKNHPPSPLAAHCAGLHQVALAGTRGGMLRFSLHTMIAAILARIFARLEHLIQLWQTGQLPPLPQATSRTQSPHPDSAQTPAARAHTPRTRRTANHRARTTAAPGPAHKRPTRHQPPPAQNPATAPSRTFGTARPRSARAPPIPKNRA